MKLTWYWGRWIIAASILILAAALIGYFRYTASLPMKLRAAEGKAHEFCNTIATSSDISAVVAKAKAEGIFWGDVHGYTFYFPATMFDKAVCEVNVDREGKVVSKSARMEND